MLCRLDLGTHKGSEDSASANADITQHIVRVFNEKDKMRLGRDISATSANQPILSEFGSTVGASSRVRSSQSCSEQAGASRSSAGFVHEPATASEGRSCEGNAR